MYINREITPQVVSALQHSPVTAVLGPRQCGKSTMVKHLLSLYPDSIYLDLERPSDLRKLDNAEWFLSSQKGKLICIDEVQRMPDLFPLIRSLVDEWGTNTCFLVLGSASRDLLKQSSETLAGRISYIHLTPFLRSELGVKYRLEKYLTAGGFPRSVLVDDAVSYKWRSDFIATFLERDLLLWAGFAPLTMRKLWQMLANNNGQLSNYSTYATSLGVSVSTVINYIQLLEGTFMVDVLRPYVSNLGKRLVKSPKVYIADSGITAALLELRSFEQLSGHPVLGSVWEQTVLSNLKGHFPSAEYYFYRTSNGAELDIVMTLDREVYAIECKSSQSPSLSRGNYNAIEDVAPVQTFVAAPVTKGWPMAEQIEVVNLDELIKGIKGRQTN